MVGAENVDRAVEAALELVHEIGDVRCPVGGRAILRAQEDAVLVVAVAGRARPQRTVLLVGVEPRQELGQPLLELALQPEAVEVDAEPLERRLDRLQHQRHRVALQGGEIADVRRPDSRPRAAARPAARPRPTPGTGRSARPSRCSSTRARPRGPRARTDGRGSRRRRRCEPRRPGSAPSGWRRPSRSAPARAARGHRCRRPLRPRASRRAPTTNHSSFKKMLTKPGPATSARSTAASRAAASAISAAISRGGRRRAPASCSATFVA